MNRKSLESKLKSALSGLALGGALAFSGCETPSTNYTSQNSGYSMGASQVVEVQQSRSSDNGAGEFIFGTLLGTLGVQRNVPEAVFAGDALANYGAAKAGRSEVNVNINNPPAYANAPQNLERTRQDSSARGNYSGNNTKNNKRSDKSGVYLGDIPQEDFFRRMKIKEEQGKYYIPQDHTMQVLFKAFCWEEATPLQRQMFIEKEFVGKKFEEDLEKNKQIKFYAKYGEMNSEIGVYTIIAGTGYEDTDKDGVGLSDMRNIRPDWRFKVNEKAMTYFCCNNRIPYLVSRLYQGDEKIASEISTNNCIILRVENNGNPEKMEQRVYWKKKLEDSEKLICVKVLEFCE